jgi:energy-converting hydrogenase A subunit M
MMNIGGDDCAKRRLVDRDEIAVAVKLLLEHGYSEESIGPQLSRFYYVDIDALNDVLARHLATAMMEPDLEYRRVA